MFKKNQHLQSKTDKKQNWKIPFGLSLILFGVLLSLQYLIWNGSDEKLTYELALSFASLLGYFYLTSRLIFKLILSDRRLLEQRAASHELADSTFEGIVITKDQYIISCNAAFGELFHVPREMLIGNQIEKFFPANHGSSFEISISRLGQEDLLLQVQQKKLNNLGYDWVYSVRDVSEQKKQEKILLERNAQIASANRLANLGEVASGIAHEVNNPLTVIMGRARILLDLSEKNEWPPVKFKESLEKIIKTTEKVATIVKTMLLLSRDTQQENFETINLQAVVEESLSLGREKFEDLKIKIKVAPATSPLWIRGNYTMIGQVVLNLLINSRDAIQHLNDKWISIDFKETSDSCQLIITDSGKGVQSELREKIFLPFYTTKDPRNGTGLGLSLCQSIIKKHSGNIMLNSDCANTQFVISFPRIALENTTKFQQAA